MDALARDSKPTSTWVRYMLMYSTDFTSKSTSDRGNHGSWSYSKPTPSSKPPFLLHILPRIHQLRHRFICKILRLYNKPSWHHSPLIFIPQVCLTSHIQRSSQKLSCR